MRFSQNSAFHVLERLLWHHDFLLIFGECATLMGKNVLSRGFFKVCIFWSRNYGNRTFRHILRPPNIFQYPLLKTILTLTLFCMQSLKKFG